ncbi:flagellar basal body rod protein FlgC [Nitrospira sp. Kam-Ns4a]
MDINTSLAISVSALDAQRHRLNVIASNLANAQSTRTAEGGPYRRRMVLFRAVPLKPLFRLALVNVGAGSMGAGAVREGLVGVTVSQITEDLRPGKVVYDPTHPDADKNGYVHLPNVNVLEEMVDLMTAHRAYEANLQAINAVRAMWNRALEISR